ncbi:MAG: hypothetical protein JXA37_10640 [Chloroflexia bacterium]|nr:hypothetical protein [Chloroflexia bacterium]
MSRLTPGLQRAIWLLGITLTCFVFAFPGKLRPQTSRSGEISPLAQATPTPTCPPDPCSPPAPHCAYQNRFRGYQPERYKVLRAVFNSAASNNLGNAAPVYPTIADGIPPLVTPVPVSSDQPIPHVILRGMAWEESGWKQFADDDDTCACTVVSSDDPCGYGIAQATTCMDGTCGWYTPISATKDLIYNLGTGTNWLIRKWNTMSNPVPWYILIGSNDHTTPEHWYFAITAYNGWTLTNYPNNEELFEPDRPPYGEKAYSGKYPYQEKVWGRMANPAVPPPIPPDNDHPLWRQTRIAWVPRGMWGLFGPGNWRPPTETTKPVFNLVRGIEVANGTGPIIVLHNTTGRTQAADVALYNNNHNFNRWWLGHYEEPYPYPLIRIAAGDTFTVTLTRAFTPTATFNGYARIAASEGVEATLLSPPPPPPAYQVFLPIISKRYNPGILQEDCYDLIQNGGFETFKDGKPQQWEVSSADDYPLADGTWFYEGHYGAHLGGYDDLDGYGDIDDTLVQTFTIPLNALWPVELRYAWYIQSEEATGWDSLHIYVEQLDGTIVEETTVRSTDLQDDWGWDTFDLYDYRGQTLRLYFEADTSRDWPTSFFVDNVTLWVCTSPP